MFTLIPYANAILLTMMLSGDYLSIFTIDKAHGRSQRFLIKASMLGEWLNSNDGTTLTDCDLHNFLSVYRFNRDTVTMRFSWLSANSRNDLKGYQQTMLVPADQLYRALRGFRPRVLVEPDVIPQSKLRFTGSAQGLIARISQDKLNKRALSKALRDNFHWRDAYAVTFSADWGMSFAFYDETGMHGGLVRHERTVRGKDGKAYVAVKYEVHT